MSDTPRTDAEALKWGPHEGVPNVVIPAYFARQLERELASAHDMRLERHELATRLERELAEAKRLLKAMTNPPRFDD